MASIEQIQQQIAGLKTQEDLNKFFATSGYTAAELAQAAPQFGDASAYQDAMAKGAQAYAATQSQAAINPTATTWANGIQVGAGDLAKYGQGAYVPPTYADGRINTTDPAFLNFMNTATPEQINDFGNQWNFNAQQTDRSGSANPGNAGVGSLYNNISWMPTDTYAGYTAKYNAGKASQDPLTAWLGSGESMLTQDQWNAQNNRVAASPNTWGGGDTPESRAAEAARTAAYGAVHPTGVAGTANPGSGVTPGPLTQITSWGPAELRGGGVQPGQTAGSSSAITQAKPINWGDASGSSFNTPVFDALHAAQQQKVTAPGALTQAITGP